MDYKIISFLEGMYARKLTDDEIAVLGEILKEETLETFKDKYAFTLSKKVDYFTPSKMKKLIDEQKEMQVWLESVGIKNINELYEN
jgi:hypothetical protein